jgi:hypothetical protein
MSYSNTTLLSLSGVNGHTSLTSGDDRHIYPYPSKPFDLERSVGKIIEKKSSNNKNDFATSVNVIRASLKSVEPNIQIVSINKTPSPHLYEVSLAVGSLYVTSDGMYLIKNDIFDLVNKKTLKSLSRSTNDKLSQSTNVSGNIKESSNTPATVVPPALSPHIVAPQSTTGEDPLAKLGKVKTYVEVIHPKAKELIEEKIKPRHYITYPRSENTKGSDKELVVFTDPSCINCRNFHRKISEFNDLGVTIKYLPYPRDGISSVGYKALDGVYCIDNAVERKNAIERAFDKERIGGECNSRIVNLIPKYFRPLIGGGTPRIATSNGYMIRGNHSVSDIMNVLSLK